MLAIKAIYIIVHVKYGIFVSIIIQKKFRISAMPFSKTSCYGNAWVIDARQIYVNFIKRKITKQKLSQTNKKFDCKFDG